MGDDADLREIRDRLEIADLLTRYTAVVDFRRWAELDQVFAEDGTADYTPTGGVSGDYRTVMAWLDRALAAWPVNLHLIGNLAITLDGDAATCRSYFLAPMAAGPVGAQESVINGGLYEDALVRTPAGWRIKHRTCTTTVMVGSLPPAYTIPE